MEVVFPKNLDELNYEDLKECVQKLESYVLYMKERLEFMMNKVSPTGVLDSIKQKGMNADFIKTGSITSENGEFSLNMNTGVVNMLQANLNGGGINLGNGAFTVDNNGNVRASTANITGGGISIGGAFGVDASGNCVANSFNSSNANITGGTINMAGATTATQGIKLYLKSNTNRYTSMTPTTLEAVNGTNLVRVAPDAVNILVNGIVRVRLTATDLQFYNADGSAARHYPA